VSQFMLSFVWDSQKFQCKIRIIYYRCRNPGYQVTQVSNIWDPQNGTCFIPPSWHLQFWDGSSIFEKFVHSWLSIKLYIINYSLHLQGMLVIIKHSIIPIIWMLVIQLASYPDQLGPSGNFVKNSTKLICLEITVKCYGCLEPQIRCGQNV
jgi:hypothetical protein